MISASWFNKHGDDDGYDYAPAACIEVDGDDDDSNYDYAPATYMEGNNDDNDDGGYDYAPAAKEISSLFFMFLCRLTSFDELRNYNVLVGLLDPFEIFC